MWLTVLERGVDSDQVEVLLHWHPADRAFMPGDAEGTVWLIDSWLVEDGRCRLLAAHLARFRASCALFAPGFAGETEAFLSAVAKRLPTRGRWFPRIELAFAEGKPQLRLWLRHAPPRSSTTRLWLAAEPDRRAHPTVKGPDLSYLMRTRQGAIERGADEAVLLSPSGTLLEGSMSSLLWWQEERLCGPPEDRLLPGITRTVLFDLAKADGIETCHAVDARPADLAGCEIWIVNALHGIRHVVAWDGVSVETTAAARAARWNTRLDQMAVPVGTR